MPGRFRPKEECGVRKALASTSNRRTRAGNRVEGARGAADHSEFVEKPAFDL
jgi:hypothetical protein